MTFRLNTLSTDNPSSHPEDALSPIHQSRFNRSDKAPANGRAAHIHHIYRNGTGTIEKDDTGEYPTPATPTRKP